MLIPLSYTNWQEDGWSYVEYQNVAFRYFNDSDLASPYISSVNLTRLFAAICICIPAVYMNYKLAKSPWSHSDRKLSLSVFLGTLVLAEYFSKDFPPWELRWLFDSGYYLPATWDLNRFGLLIITFLIIIPLFIRETKIVGSLRQESSRIIDIGNTNQESILEKSAKRLSKKYLILGVTLGLIAVIIPVQIYFIQYDLLPFPNTAYQYEGYTFFFQFTFENQPIPYHLTEFNFEMFSPGDMLNQLPYAGFQLLFVYGLLQYIQRNLSKKRTYLLGALSLVVPFVYRISAYIAHSTEGEYVIPIPVVLIIGLIVLRFVKPIDPTLQSGNNSILDKTGESASPKQRDRIRIPLLYVVRSKFSKILRRKSENV
jgi:hypothetical protein